MLLLAALVLLPLLLVVAIGYAVVGEPYRPIFKRYRLPMPEAWPDISLLHISDLHVRRDDPRLLRVQKAALRNMAPDLVCVTGDVCEKVEDIPLLVELLCTTRPKYGTFVVLGNHEHNARAPVGLREHQKRGLWPLIHAVLHLIGPRVTSDGEDEGHAMADALRAAGITVLHNEGTSVQLDGQRSLWIAGCDSAWAGHADMHAAMRGRRPGEACLALIHEPDLAFEAERHGADLVLAGHTHGGQIRLPVVGTPYTLRTDPRISIASGFQVLEDALLHITAGLGHTIPLRFGCPPEVVWLDCAPAANFAVDQPAA